MSFCDWCSIFIQFFDYIMIFYNSFYQMEFRILNVLENFYLKIQKKHVMIADPFQMLELMS